MALDLKRFITRFLGEGREQLTRLAEGLGALEQRPADSELINALFRAAHTLKGSARMLKLGGISETAHRLEDLLGELREGRRAADAALTSLLLAGVDAIALQLDQVEAGVADPIADPGLLARLATAMAPADREPETPAPASAAGPAPPPTPHAADSVRVPLAKLDELVRQIGEVMAMQQHLRERLNEVHGIERRLRNLVAARPDPALADAGAALTRFTRALRDDLRIQDLLSASLSDSALVLRMLPLSMVFDPNARMVRELARTLGKEVRCEISGGDIELDRQIIDRLGDALMHVLRNAVDHGIEDPAERRAAGKPAVAQVHISARPTGGGVVVEVSDDGRGLNRERILAKAIARGLLDAETAATLSDEQVWELVYTPGLSTSDIITELSGRGVGMDVIRGTIIDVLRGSISLISQPGVGSRVSFKLPLSLAVMRLVLLEAGGRRYALAARHVVELIRVASASTILVAGRPAVVLRNEFIPLLPLAELLRLPAGAGEAAGGPRRPALVVVIGVRAAKLGLVIDGLRDERDMVIKALPGHLCGGGLVAGIVVDGDNTLVSVLHAPALMDAARRARGELTAREAARAADPHAVAGARRILVVDDSLNTREIVKDVLEAYGYHVATAEDGLDGWQKAIGGQFDAVLTDVEMPGLDGFALTARLRGHPRYQATPIIIVTSRETEADKQRGIAAGADAYIVKGDFDQSGLLDTLGNLLGES